MKNNKPAIVIQFENESFKVLKIHGQPGDVILSHKVDNDALLQVLKGAITYKQAEIRMPLRGTISHPIPKDILHELKFEIESEALLILVTNTKMTFSKSS